MLNRTHIRRKLAAVAARLRMFRIALALYGLPPIAGGDETPEEKAAREKKEADEAAAKKKADDGWTPPTKQEWDNMQRQQRETAAALKKIQDDQAEAQRKADEEAGNYKEIAEREKARADAAEAKAQETETKATAAERKARAERVAGRLNFRDPEDVLHRLSDEQLETDSATEKALTALATEKRYLVTDGELPRQRDVTGEPTNGADPTTPEPTGVDRMSRAYAASETKT